MGVSILDLIKEEVRQGITGDDRYHKNLPWVFRLVVVGEVFVGPTGADGTAIFPLPLSPERFEYTLPFANQLTPQQESGVVVERAGIVIADISISATTGWKMRTQLAVTSGGGNAQFTSILGEGGLPLPATEVSGQMAWWTLANRCFEGYSNLCKDPRYANKTRLELHIMKEQLHLEVVPTQVRLHREVARERVTYRYEIGLKVIGPAKELIYDAIDDKSLFQSLKDTISKIRSTIQSIKALVDDVTAALDELSRFASGLAGILDDIGDVISAADDLVNGVKSFLDIPSRFLDSVSTAIGSVADLFEDIASLPADVYQTFRKLEDQFDALKVSASDHFDDGWSRVAEKYNAASSPTPPSVIRNEYPEIQNDIDAAATRSADGTMSITSAFGAVKPGDQRRQELALPGDRLDPKGYSGFSERTLGQGDTLQSLAARFLGDARRWPEIALVNNLRAPYLTNDSNLPGTLKVGAPITIPMVQAKQGKTPIVTASETALGASQVEEQLGRDLFLVREGDQFGWAIDTAHGSVDGQIVGGVDNLGQAIETRLRTTRGENILYPGVGLPRLIGSSPRSDTRGEVALRVRQQILADPRVESLVAYSLRIVADQVVLEATVRPVGSSTNRVISRTLT